MGSCSSPHSSVEPPGRVPRRRIWLDRYSAGLMLTGRHHVAKIQRRLRNLRRFQGASPCPSASAAEHKLSACRGGNAVVVRWAKLLRSSLVARRLREAWGWREARGQQREQK